MPKHTNHLDIQNKEKEKRAAELVIVNKEIAPRLQNIQALGKIDRAILGSQDLNLTLRRCKVVCVNGLGFGCQ
ncbi:MAG: hypothetical protein P1P74_12465 [Desulfuromonadales bacterium]|nr:hypothetical protein [Desulfuromonadales bacterium]